MKRRITFPSVFPYNNAFGEVRLVPRQMTDKSSNLTTPESDARQCALAPRRSSALNHP